MSNLFEIDRLRNYGKSREYAMDSKSEQWKTLELLTDEQVFHVVRTAKTDRGAHIRMSKITALLFSQNMMKKEFQKTPEQLVSESE